MAVEAPGVKFRFTDSLLEGRAVRIRGLRYEIQTEQWRDGADPTIMVTVPSGFGSGVATFEKALVGGKSIQKLLALDCKNIQKQDILVEVMDGKGATALSLILSDAFVTTYELGDLDALTSEIAVESIGVSYDRLL